MSPDGKERRRRRTLDVALALRYQLDACRGTADMEALVVADEDGLCLAASGPAETCHEVAAVLPFLGGRRGDFRGTVLSARGGMRVLVRTVEFGASELYVCAVGGTEERRAGELERSVLGVSRILAAA
ncbi:MAG: hypothetical protein HYY06_02405 [Deltaproteobacteria bacterium]|nr:hypothetical protein [Deltaproteobacteria bacterium]